MLLRKIQVACGVGSASTELAAFDRALLQCGLENLNLIPLSSVIPPVPVLEVKRIEVDESSWGARCFCVLSRASTADRGATVSAGLGWLQDPFSLRGLFVEHHASSAAAVEALCTQSLIDMANDRNCKFDSPKFSTATITCVDQPVCAIAVAVYSICDWNFCPTEL